MWGSSELIPQIPRREIGAGKKYGNSDLKRFEECCRSSDQAIDFVQEGVTLPMEAVSPNG